MPSRAFIFPGQGSQTVGMGRDLAATFAAAREVFDEVDHILGQRLSKVMFEGPGEALTLTENAQPALMAMSLAVVRVLQSEGGVRPATHAHFLAGHSLGEYSALAAGGSLSVADAARLLRLRGQAMQRAVTPGDGAMAALIGVELPLAIEICAAAADGAVVEAANDNGGGQVVISGNKLAIERAVEQARARGVRRAMLLPVSAPFHCALMAPAAAVMQEALRDCALTAPCVPIVANVSAAPVSDPSEIRALLVRQVTGTVRWRESVQAMVAAGVDQFYELGAGRVLTGLVRRIAPEVTATSAGTPSEIEALLKTR
jgi:[acyl-carrier-protein] S-malonyltransferase